jgi:nucleoside-diphosphate-sugar epimerase
LQRADEKINNMKPNSGKKRIVFTGSAGFLGRALYRAFEGDYGLRLSDINGFASEHETVIGDVTDFSFCRRLVRGMDLLVVAHMMPHPYGEDPSMAFDVNVKGVANLFHAAKQEGIKRACLISSTSVCGDPDPAVDCSGMPPVGFDLYSSTKACQEVIAQACHVQSGMEVASLRVGYVVDCAEKKDKYGKSFEEFLPGMVDRHDVGEVARKFLELPGLGYKAMHVYSFSEPGNYPSAIPTFEFLNWKSRYSTAVALPSVAA